MENTDIGNSDDISRVTFEKVYMKAGGSSSPEEDQLETENTKSAYQTADITSYNQAKKSPGTLGMKSMLMKYS